MDAFVPEVAPPPLLECRDLTKRYGATVALDRFTVSLPAGRIVGLLGPNGSGKTTLLKMIAGVAHPTAGDIRVAGYEVGPESKALVSYLPERPYFSRSMRVREMIAYFADFYEDFDAALARDMLARLGVPEDAPTSALSKGTVEKVQLTLVMARHAALYLLDEPIGGVDPATRDYIIHTILSNYNENASLVISTHLIADVENVLDDVIFINKGRILLQQSVDQIRQEKGCSVDELFREVFRYAE